MNDQQLADSLDLISKGFRSLKGIGEVQSADKNDILFDEWDWEVGVGLYGDLRDAQRRNDKAGLERIARWYDWQIDRGLPRRQVNSTAPMLALTLLSEHYDRPDWNKIIIDWAQWLHESMPKTDEGGFQHLVKERGFNLNCCPRMECRTEI